MTLSLQSRLLLAATAVVAAFLALTGFALDRAFRHSAEVAVHDRLQGQLYGLLAAAELDETGRLELPPALPEPRFAAPGSGLYGAIADAQGEIVWRSTSLLSLEWADGATLAPGVSRFERIEARDGTTLYRLRYGVDWEGEGGESHRFTIGVAEDLQRFRAQVDAFRRSLALWLGGATAMLLLVEAVVLRWGLAPLRRVAADLRAVEAGSLSELGGRYPRELMGLTSSINAFIRNERERLDRYRNTLADLAHSLKTPLAVLRGLFNGEPDAADGRLAREQLGRMAGIVDYQLRRAATSGRRTLPGRVDVRDAVDKVIGSLAKVYADKRVDVGIDIDGRPQFQGEEGDLLEALGNVLDNAYKWCAGRVRVRAASVTSQRGGGTRLELVVEDDGPGIPDALLHTIVERGARLDDTQAGQGIGLAVVRDIVDAYAGTLEFGRGPLGGARVTLRLG